MIVTSIVIPVRNGADTLAAQFRALEQAIGDRSDIEVVVADNGSTDATLAIVAEWRDHIPVRRIDAGREAGINVARNDGVRNARATRILLCDADDEVDPAWINRMVDAFDDGDELLAGPINYQRLNSSDARQWRGADDAGVIEMLGYLPSGHGANMAFTRELFDRIGGFDEQFRGGGDDVDFFWRAQLAGAELREVDDAIVHYRLRSSLGASWRQSVGYGTAEAALFAKFRDQGLKRRPPIELAQDIGWLIARLPFTVQPRWRAPWLRRLGTLVGRVRGGFVHRTLWW